MMGKGAGRRAGVTWKGARRSAGVYRVRGQEEGWQWQGDGELGLCQSECYDGEAGGREINGAEGRKKTAGDGGLGLCQWNRNAPGRLKYIKAGKGQGQKERKERKRAAG